MHGAAGLQAAERATAVFFGAEIDRTTDAALQEIFSDVPSAEVGRSTLESGLNVCDAFALAGLCKTKSEAKRTVQEGGAYVNNRRIAAPEQSLNLDDLASETTMVLRRGKKNFALLRLGS